MQLNVAFCPHFHQPHFQLHRTREEAYANSYLPWLEMLKEAVKMPGFYINLHFSGPFLYWIQERKPEYLRSLRQEVLASGKVGLIGGLVDEAFSQLSSRPDDVCYQLEQYDQLLSHLTGVYATDWQGIHVVEREAGEMLLGTLAWTARRLGAPPVVYLDAETFFEPHFAYPGSEYDYCRRFFNINDAYSLTTISHLPEEMLYFALRDEIMGQPFYSLPVHARFRYLLLKRKGFDAQDHSLVTPRQYVYEIKEAGFKAARMAREMGKDIEPVVVIFEDAEKFGQWSHDPAGDAEWMMEFFWLLTSDPEVKMSGLRQYVETQGILGTYPVKTSHSYPEWENWTAHRGIRGVVLGDERLSRVMSRLRDVEKKQEILEKEIFYNAQQHYLRLAIPGEMEAELFRAIMNSPERYSFFRHLINRYYPQPYRKAYQLLMRVRNLVYQEDPKWASRHPSYGSSPYYDMQALSYLEVAERLIDQVRLTALGSKFAYPTLEVRDWDFDGQDEVVVRTQGQMVVADTQGGNLCFQQAVDPDVGHDLHHLLIMLDEFTRGVPAYSSIHSHIYPLVCMETDSSLARVYYPEGGRVEKSRGFGRLEFMIRDGERLSGVGSLDDNIYQLDEMGVKGSGALVCFKTTGNLTLPGGGSVRAHINKRYYVHEYYLVYRVEVRIDSAPADLYVMPQLLVAATPSDEIDFKPVSFLGVCGKGRDITYQFQDTSVIESDGHISYSSFDQSLPQPEEIHYVYTIKNGSGKEFKNLLRFQLGRCPVRMIRISPAVRNYYQGYVFSEQSNLGMHSSGLMLEPLIRITDGKADFEITMDWRFNTHMWKEEFCAMIPMVGYNR